MLGVFMSYLKNALALPVQKGAATKACNQHEFKLEVILILFFKLKLFICFILEHRVTQTGTWTSTLTLINTVASQKSWVTAG